MTGQQVCALPEGVRYYISRDNTVMVPLVPVDQLPFQLLGLPRQLTIRQMAEDSWKFVGETQESLTSLSVEPLTTSTSQLLPPAKNSFLSPDHNVRKDTDQLDQEPLRRSRWTPPASDSQSASELRHIPDSYSTKRPGSVTDKIASIYSKDAQRLGYHTLPPSGIQPDPTKKVYCAYWIRTGECSYTPIGCKYKHVMPSLEKLRDLGIAQEFPRWYKEKTAISAARNPNSLQRPMAQNHVDRKLSTEPPVSRVFPDPSTFTSYRHDLRHELSNDGVYVRDQMNALDELKEHDVPIKMPKPRLSQELSHPLVEVQNLIDLSDSPIESLAPPSSPQTSVSSSSSTISCSADIAATNSCPIPQPLVDEPGPELAEANVIVENVSKVKNELRPNQGPMQVAIGPVHEGCTDSNQLGSKCRSSPRKTSERPAALGPQAGLANSRYATGNKSKIVQSPSKGGGKRCTVQNRSKNLQCEIMQLKRVIHKKERLCKDIASSNVSSLSANAKLADNSSSS